MDRRHPLWPSQLPILASQNVMFRQLSRQLAFRDVTAKVKSSLIVMSPRGMTETSWVSVCHPDPSILLT